MQQVSLDEAKTQLPDLVDAALNGDEVVIAKDNQQLVKLVMTQPKPRRRAGSAKGLIVFMADDFDAPLEDFKEYME